MAGSGGGAIRGALLCENAICGGVCNVGRRSDLLRVKLLRLYGGMDGATTDDFIEWFPGVRRAQVEAVLRHTEASLLVPSPS